MTFLYQSWPARTEAILKLLQAPHLYDGQVEQLRTFVRAAGDQIQQLEARVFILGAFECARCKIFVGVDMGAGQPAPTSARCPKGCGPMWRITWQKRAEEAEEKLLQAQHRKPRCERCDGQGELDDGHGKSMTCTPCKGTGYLEKDRG
jgi:hypothetical protein